MAEQQLTVSEFAARIKAKYPEYKDINDLELSRKIVDKYPEYKSVVIFDDLKKKEEAIPSPSLDGESVSPEIEKKEDTFVEDALASSDFYNPVGKLIKGIPGIAEVYSGVENLVGSVFKAGEMAIRENLFAYASSNPAVAAAQNILRTASPIDNKISDALGAMGDFFMESSERTLLNKQKEYGISEEEISRGIVGNVIDGNVGTAAKLTASTVAHQIPQLAAMVATGGTAGAALLGTSAAGNKYAQIQDDPTLSSEEKAIYSLAIGAAEGLAEYMFRTDVSQIRRAFGKKETLDEFKNVLKQQLKKETLLKSTLEEGGEELVVGVVDLLIEDGLRGNFDNWNADAVLELADAALVGGIMGGGVHTVTRGVNALGSSKNERKQSEIKSDINTLNQKKKNATEDQKRVIDELIEEKVGELININTEDSEFYSNFSNEDIKEIISINKDIREASKKYNVAPSETLKKKYADEIKILRDKKQNIENKYSETPTRYIKDGKELSRTEFVDMLNAATPEELATGQWGVQNDEEVEQLLTSKLPKETQELKVEKTAAEPKTEAEPEILVKNVEDQAINYKDPVSGEIVEGTLLRDGQQAIVETKDKLIEIGNFNEIQDQPISELGIEVQLTPDVKIAGDRVVIRGKEYVSESGNLNEDINYNEEGEVVSISLNTKDGKKRTFRGATAQEFVYQTWLQENASTPEDIAQAENELQELIETDEEARNILTQLTKEPKQVRTVTKDEDTQKVEGEKQQLTDVEYINQYNEDEVAVAEIDTTATAENSRAETERVKQSPIEEEDGTTLNLDGTTYEGDGLVVPFVSDDFKSEEITPELIAEFVEKNKNKIPKGAKVVVGLYSFKGEDKVSIDLNVVVDESNLTVATEFARLMGQNSIYRISDGQTVPTGETGDNTVTLMDARARQAAIAITQGKLPQYLKGIRSPSEMAAYKAEQEKAYKKSQEKPKKQEYVDVKDLGKDDRTPKRVTDETVKKLQTMVDNFNKVLKKIGAQPYNITFAANNEQYEARYRELTGRDKSANRGTFIGSKREIIINLSSANEGTLAHEMMHAYLHALNITGKNILQLTNALYTELSTGSAIEKQIARELRKFQDEYIRRNIYGQNKTLEDPNIAEEFLTEYVGIMVQYSERIPASGKVSFAEKIRRAVLKFLTKLGIKDKSILQAIETREEAVNFINGFVNVLSDRAGIETLPTIDVKIQETADPYRAQRSEMEQIEAPAGSRLFNNPLKEATDLSRSYMDSKGLEYKEGKPFNTIDEKQAKRISDAFDAMKDDPTNPEVAAAYKALAEETIDQFEFIIKAGYNVEINNNEPYSSSGEMIEDLRTNRRMKIFSTESGFGDEKITEKQRKENPLLQRTKYKDVNGEPLLVNDLFRFVHDFFGHAKRGNGFGAKGEENAWDVHSRMYSPQARRAMTSETRGQNSYVNFSGINNEAFALRDKARKLRKEGKIEEAAELVGKVYDIMKFADQKVGLLPDEFVENPYDNPPTLQEVSEDGEAVSKEQIDAIKIISLETPRQKAKKDAVADLLNGFSESQLDPNSSEQDLISRFLSNIFEESSYTLKKGARESGMTWYIEDITEFENKMKVLLPELNDPNQMKLFKQVLAITSSGTNPNQNLQTAYTLWIRSNGNAVNFAKSWGEDKISFISKKKKAIGTGIIVRETKTKYIVQKVDALGNLETFKNGQPKLFEAKKSELKAGYPKPAGFTSRGSIVAQQLKKIEKIYKDVDGDINKLIDFFEKPQPVSQLRKYNDKVPDVDGNVRKVAVGKRNGAFIFGEKIGAFYQNMIGIGDTITMDLWWSRTWNRYMGTMLSTVKGKEVIQETPRTDRERDIMRKAVTIAAKKLNLDVSELQAVIWYFEQELWTKAGSKSPSFSYVTAVDALNSKIKTDEQTQKRFSEAGADLTAAEKRRQDAIARADNIIAQGGIQGDVDSKEQIDFVNKPLYHGSNKSFDKFDMSKAGATDEGFLGRGVYLTAEYDNAKEYGDIVNVFYADIKNPLIIEDPYSFGGVNPNKIRSTLGLDKNASVSRVTKELKNRGYDAVVVNEIEGTDAIEVAVLDPSIISDKPKTKDVAKEQIDFAGIEMKVKETPGNTDPAIKTGGMAYVPVSRLYNLMDMRDGDRGGLYETARDKKRVAEIAERFKKEGFNSTDGWYQTIYVDIDAGGFGWIGEGNHRVLAARQLGMTHLPVRVEFGAARDGKFIYDKNYSRVPTQVVSKEKIAELKEKAGKYYHIKYASIWETNLPTNQEPVTKDQIDWQRSEFGRGQVNPAIVNRTTEVQQAAVDLLEGKITNKEYQDTVKFTQTIEAITRFFLPASTKDMKESLDSNKAELLNTPIEDGKEIGLRLDIPAYKNRNIWIVSVHDKGKAGKSISYGSVAWATDVNFGSNPKVAAFIAAGRNMDTLKKQDKTTIARMLGKWKNFEGKTKEERDAAAIKKVEEIVAIENKYPGANRTGSPWRQIGMNPFRHSFFYDRRNGKPVVSASEVVQIGGLVYAKDVKYADWSSDQFTVDGYYDADGAPVKFQVETQTDKKLVDALEKGEIPAPLYKKSLGEKIYAALFRTPLEMEILKLQEKKDAKISDLEYQGREIANRIKRYAKTPEALKLANEYLTKEDKKDSAEAILKLPNGQKLLDNLRTARGFIDNISSQLANDPAFEALPDELRLAISENITTYLRAQYKFFTDKSYDIDKRRDPAIQAQFNELVAREIAMLGAMGASDMDIKQIINDSRDDIIEEATQMIDSYISDLKDVKYQPSTTGAGIKMPNAPFRAKKDLPQYIKELLGEEKNPVNRFAQTTKSLANVLYKGEMINGIIELVGKDSDYILDEKPEAIKEKQYVKVSDPYSMLDGKYVHKEVMDMVNQKPLYTTDNFWANIYFTTLKLARKSKVIWNITTWRKNLTGGWYFIMANGVANPGFAKDFARRTKLMFNVRGEEFQVDEETKQLMRIMAETGLTGKSIDANLIGISQAAFQFGLDGDENAYYERAKKIFNNIAKKDKWLQEKYAAVDDYTKLIIFRSEIQSYAKKLYGKAYDQLTDTQKDNVHDQAAERVKQSTPTFSRLPKWYPKVAVIPVVGDFISFRLESLRSYGENVGNAVSDIKKSQESGLDEVQKKEYLQSGLRRLAGSGAVFALKLGITTFLADLFLDDDDEELEEDAKVLRPEWMDGQTIIPRSIDKDGNVRVYNYSSEDPYGDVSDIFGGTESWSAMIKDFVRPNIAANLIFNLSKGEDIYGGKIADYSDSEINNMIKVLNYTAKQIVVPPTISSSFRDAYLRSELPKKDKIVNLATTIAERSVIRDYKYNIVDSFVQDLRKIGETRKSYYDYDNPAKRLKQLDEIKEQFDAIVRIGVAKNNFELIDKAEKYMKRHLESLDEEYVLDGIIIKKQ